MSLYSCHLVTRKALTLLAPNASDLPTEWFNWTYRNPSVHRLGPTRRIEFVETGNAPQVEDWYRRVVNAGLLPTIVVTTDDDMSTFQDDETNPNWGGVTPLCEGILIPDEDEPTRGWRKRLQQPDDLAIVSWLEHREGGGVNETRAFQRVPEFARCYGEELKRWIEISSNAELITKQWQDPHGWPEDCPPLESADFAWDRKHWNTEKTQLWVPMLRLPFCEIGINTNTGEKLVNGLMPPELSGGQWLFDQSGSVAAKLAEVAKSELATV